MSSFEPNKRYLRKLLIYLSNSKKSAAEAHKLRVETYGEAALSERSCHEWFKKFQKPKMYEDAELEALLDQGSCQTQGEQYDGQYFE